MLTRANSCRPVLHQLFQSLSTTSLHLVALPTHSEYHQTEANRLVTFPRSLSGIFFSFGISPLGSDPDRFGYLRPSTRIGMDRDKCLDFFDDWLCFARSLPAITSHLRRDPTQNQAYRY